MKRDVDPQLLAEPSTNFLRDQRNFTKICRNHQAWNGFAVFNFRYFQSVEFTDLQYCLSTDLKSSGGLQHPKADCSTKRS